MTPPQPPSGTTRFPGARQPGGTVEAVRARVQARLAEKLDPARLRRMPASIMVQDVKRTVEQLVEQEGSRLGRLERDLLIEDMLRDAIGFGPLEELFRDPAVNEVLVINHQTVLCQRDSK